MASDQTKEAVTLTEEEIARIEQMKKDGTTDLQAALVDYAKRMNGYPYISASRIERMPGPGERPSVLFEQMSLNYLIKNSKNPDAAKDFMDVFGNGKVIFIQAHASCPTVGPDGLYNQIAPDGTHIKTQIMGYFAIKEPDPEVTEDEYAEKDYSYFYKDINDMFVDLGLNLNVPIKEHREKYKTIYKRRTRPEFEPIIVVALPGKKFGRITGNPFHDVTPQELAAVLKEQQKREQEAK